MACNINSLSQEERNISSSVKLILLNLWGAYLRATKIVVEQCKEEFVANGRVVIEEGWKCFINDISLNLRRTMIYLDLTDERCGAESDPKKRLLKKRTTCQQLKRTILFYIRILL